MVNDVEPKRRGYTQFVANLTRQHIIIALAFIIALASYLLFFNSPPIPTKVTKQLNFPVYYPKTLPRDYSLESKSVKVANGILFFTISDNSDQITVSEQARPAKVPNLIALTQPQTVAGPGGTTANLPAMFRSVSSPAGQAIQGTGPSSTPAAIVLSGQSLINISGSSGLPNDALSTVVQSLNKL